MTNDNTKYKQFIAQVSFWRPDGGTIPILAKTADEAREILPKMLTHVKDLVILDVIDPADIQGMEEDLPPDPAESNGNSMMVN